MLTTTLIGQTQAQDAGGQAAGEGLVGSESQGISQNPD